MAETEEIKAFVKNAKEQLIDAKISLREKRYHLSFLCSALSAENVTSALIITLGRRASKRHNNWMILGSLASDVNEEMKTTIQEISIKLHEIEPHIPKLLRYPFRYRERWLIPPEYYTNEMAEEALGKAKHILKLTSTCLKKLKIAI
ncbi:HEPN domain-containing protein [Candidatus Bathyarchaeota archaeon]|nr:MAG: HEPN domain-containing protein [Candidatus Bathyarchaeota archaeon]